MGYALKDRKGGFNSYYCDSADDIAKLPTQKGNDKGETCPAFSEAFVIEDSSVWVLTMDTDTWTQI